MPKSKHHSTPDTTTEEWDEKLETPVDEDRKFKEQVEEKTEPKAKPFGTFSGVFTPTLLTILGVIMYLREGWVVGNAGLLGAWLIILLSFTITACTGLSLSSIVTNIRIGAGGAFSIISQSLGLEVGGSIGIPLYLSQALAVSMYVFGFRAGWTWVFPEHPAIIVDFAVFGALFVIAFISASLAFRIQYLILAIIIGSLVSVAAASFTGVLTHDITWWGEFPGSPEDNFSGVTFMAVFAVFFPASTGIMAGANMSGELKNPRKSIPIGTLSAIGISLIIYLALAYWLARAGSMEELASNYTIMIDKAAYGPIVLAGLLGATFSSALSSLVGAPRILQALAQHKILPKSGVLAKKTKSGEPRNAMLLTGAIVAGALMLRDLNAVAPLITMFFLITYAMINIVVFMEQSLKLVSFRPLFRIPRFVSLFGALGCISVMFIVNTPFCIAAIVVVVVIHALLIRKHLKSPYGDVRSGLFTAVAEWAAKRVKDLAPSTERTWKADLLTPVEELDVLDRMIGLMEQIAKPEGFIKLVGLTGRTDFDTLADKLSDLDDDFKEKDIFASWTVISVAEFGENLTAGMEAFGGAFFKPNVLYLPMPKTPDREQEVLDVITKAARNDMGVLLFAPHEGSDPCKAEKIVVQFDKEHDFTIKTDLDDMDLALLTAIKLKQNLEVELHLSADPDAEYSAGEHLAKVAELARIPDAAVDKNADVSGASCIVIRRLPEKPDFQKLREKAAEAGCPCLFAMDSGTENAYA